MKNLLILAFLLCSGCGGGEIIDERTKPEPVIEHPKKAELKLMVDEFVLSLPDRVKDVQKINYYYEINTLINAGKIYNNPERFGVTDVTDIENYLLTAVEEYFKPCSGYDFYNDPKSSCMSEFKLGDYHLWRSPLNDGAVTRIAHAKIEWRSAAGVSEAVKALLKSSKPEVVERANEVKYLIKSQVWEKWNDTQFLRDVGLSDSYLIERVSVVHYLAWLEMIASLIGEESLIPRIMEFAEIDDYINIKCRVSGSCDWHGYELADSGSNDLSHLAMVMYVLYQQDLHTYKVVKTLKEKTWADIEGYNFPKFDMFLNGYCKNVIQGESLYEYCNTWWVTEERTNNSHRQLFGFVEYGREDKELMEMLLEASDTNKDGVINSDDVLVSDFAVNLYDLVSQ